MKKKDMNTGTNNSGNYNSGNRNSGDRNSGDRNSGDRNSGNWNSGHYNSGYYNSGHYNSGDRNSGYYNSGHYNSGFFNTNEPTVRLFNKDTGKLRKDINVPYFELKTTEWISEDEMTNEQKKADPNYKTNKGTLITRTYKEAWKLLWSELKQEDKDLYLNLPNFCPVIFEEITGINVQQNSCAGKVVEIDGKKYKLTEV